MKRFKPLIFVGVILSMLIMFIGVNSSAVLAAQSEKEEYGLKVTMTTDKDDYGKEENIKATFDFQNNSEKVIKEVQLSNEIPEGYAIEENEIKQQIGDINPGEVKQANVTYIPTAKNSEGVVDNLSDGSNTPIDSGKKMAAKTVSNTPVTRAAGNTTSGVASATGTAPSTGDTSSVPVWAIVAISASGVAILSYFVIKKKAGGKVLAIILCAGIAGASISGLTISKTYAEEIPVYGGYNIRTSVNVDGEQKDLSSDVAFTISYEESNKAEEPDEEGDFTREQWLTELFNNLGLEEWAGDYDLFDDVEDAENKNIINALIESEIVSVFTDEYNMDYIYPKSGLTRECLSETLYKALNLTLENDVDTSSWGDLAEIKNLSAAKAVVKAGILQLEDNNFMPNKKVTKREYERANDFLKKMLLKETDESDEVIFKDSVSVTKASAYTIDTEKRMVNIFDKSIAKDWKKGETHVLIDEKNHTKDVTFIITDISEDNEKIVISYTNPAIEEVIESININKRVPVTEIIPADGVSIVDGKNVDWDISEDEYKDMVVEDEEDEDASVGLLQEKINDEDTYDELDYVLASVDDTHLADVNGRYLISGETCFEYEIAPGQKVCFGIDDLHLNVAVRGEPFINYSNFTFDGNLKLKYSGSLKKGAFKKGKTEIKLGDVPFPTWIPCVNGAIAVYAVVEVSASGSISVSMRFEGGARYQDGFARIINDFKKPNIQFSVKGTAKAGGKLATEAKFLNTWTLVQLSVGAGLKGELSGKTNFSNFVCIDASVLPYCALGCKFLDNEKLSLNYDFDLPKFKKLLHFEESGFVEECTRKNGYTGKVVSSDGYSISKAKIELLTDGGRLENKTKSNNLGNFTGASAPSGTYTLIVSASGHQAQVIEGVNIIEGSIINLGTIILLSSNTNLPSNATNNGALSIKGTISDSTNNYIVPGATVSAIDASLNNRGEVISQTISDLSGDYQLNVDAGTYKIVVEKDGYVNGVSQITVNRNVEGHNFSLSPSDQTIVVGNLRAVLKWGETPSDLDSHLVAKNINDPFHVYYSEKYAGDIQILDVDDTTSFGPETITLNQVYDGTYSYYIHDYSNKDEEDSDIMNLSGAYVEVYSGNKKVATFNIDTTKRGTLWHVFDYDAKTGRLTFVDQYSYQTDPGAVGSNYGGGMNDEADEKVDSQILMMDDDGEDKETPKEDAITLPQDNTIEQNQETTAPTTNDGQDEEQQVIEEQTEQTQMTEEKRNNPVETSEPQESIPVEKPKEIETIAA